MSRFVKYVASNVKGGISAKLGRLTLIVGPNGSGKTAVQNSLELALAGFASDIAGREEMAKESDLLALAPNREGELFARAVLDDNTEAKWHAGRKGAKKAEHQHPPSVIKDLVFPLRPVRDAIRGKPETARKFFIGYALPNLTKDDVLVRIDEELHKHYHSAILSADISASPVDKLLLALEYAAKHARDGKKKATGQTEIVAVVADGLEPLPTDEVMKAIQKEAADAKKAIEGMDQARGAHAQLGRMQQQMEPVKHELAQAEANVHQLREGLQQLDFQLSQTPPPASFDDHTQRVMAIIEKLAALEQQTQAPQSCPVCKTQAQLGTFVHRDQAAKAFVAAEQAKSGPFEMLRQQRSQLAHNLAAWENKVIQLHTQLNALSNASAAGSVLPPSEEQYAAAQARQQRANAEITRIETIKAQWAQAKAAKSAASDSSKEVDQWVKLRDACTAAVADLLDAGVARFVARVQAFLPESDVFDLQLRDGQKQTFRFGLKRNGVLHTALSGAEWARVMGAISAACADADKLSVLIPEERAFDGETLYATLEALGKMPGQMIITTPNFPIKGGQYAIPDGWTVIQTATGAHRTTQYES